MDSSPISSSASLSAPRFRCFDPTNSYTTTTPNHNPIPRHRNNYKGTLAISVNSEPKIVSGEAGYVLEDVPHFTDYIPDLPVRISLSLSLSLSLSHFKALFGCWEMKGKIKWFFIFLITIGLLLQRKWKEREGKSDFWTCFVFVFWSW